LSTAHRFLGFGFAAADLLLEIRDDGKVAFGLGAGEAVLGVSDTALADRPWKSLIHDDDHAMVEALFGGLGDTTRAPIGWVEFCADNAAQCQGGPTQPRDIVMSQAAWRDLVKVNRWVNETVKPLTDQEHWGVIERWSLPSDGYGDCEDYVLLKRKMLMDAGWPREALLITVVRDKKGEGHAVLTVKTDKGEFVLDNQNENVVAWTETGYRFVKRQSQGDPNVWVSLGDTKPAVSTASARD